MSDPFEKFEKYGDLFELVESHDRKAIWRRTNPHGGVQYEVHVMYRDKKGELHHPGASMWGGEIPQGKSAKGWTFLKEEEAKAHYDKINTK